MENSNTLNKKLINSGGDQINDWNAMWSRRDFFSKIVDTGRWFYNLFFRRLLLKHIKDGSSMIELGCGSSTLSLSIAGKIKNLVGIDNSKEAIVISKKNAIAKGISNAHFIETSIFNLPIELKNKFDLVWSQGLLEHFDDYLTTVKAHLGVAEERGIILISVPYKYSYIYLWYLLSRNKILSGFWPYTDQKFLTYRELKEIGRKISQNYSAEYSAYFLPPLVIGFILGIVIFEIKKLKTDGADNAI